MWLNGLQRKILWSFWIVGGLFSFSVSEAQCPTTIPNVQSYGTGAYSFKKIGEECLPFTISVKNNMIGVQNVRTIFDYQGGPLTPELQTTDTIHTYTRPGEYTLVQLSEKDGRQLIACPRIFVSDTVPPKVRLILCGNTGVTIIFDTPQVFDYDTYWISWGDGNIEEVLPYQKSVPHTYQAPINRKITIWGVKKNGSCKSHETVLVFTPTQNPLHPSPSIRSLTMHGADKGELTIINPIKAEIILLSMESTSGWQPIGRAFYQENETAQILVDSLKATCFIVQASDSCLAEFYKSNTICTSSLQLKGVDDSTQLSWSSMVLAPSNKVEIWKDGKSWKDITSLYSAESLVDMDLTCGFTHCYQLVITSQSGRFTSNSRCRLTPYDLCGVNSPLFIPEAFSPNEDGINDLFEIKGIILSSFELSIFNPWGSIVFHSKEPQTSWDGTFNSAPSPAGYYIYKVSLKNLSTGKLVVRTGSILLIR